MSAVPATASRPDRWSSASASSSTVRRPSRSSASGMPGSIEPRACPSSALRAASCPSRSPRTGLRRRRSPSSRCQGARRRAEGLPPAAQELDARLTDRRPPTSHGSRTGGRPSCGTNSGAANSATPPRAGSRGTRCRSRRMRQIGEPCPGGADRRGRDWVVQRREDGQVLDRHDDRVVDQGRPPEPLAPVDHAMADRSDARDIE